MEITQQEPIFVVDDDQGILESFDAMLGDDYQLVMISDGDQALEMLSRHHPRLLFLDLQIPGPDGLAVLAGILVVLLLAPLTATFHRSGSGLARGPNAHLVPRRVRGLPPPVAPVTRSPSRGPRRSWCR